MADRPDMHDYFENIIQAVASGEDAHAFRRHVVRQVYELIEHLETNDDGVIVTNNVVDWIIGTLTKYYPERDWIEDRVAIYNTVDTFLMLTYDTRAAQIYDRTREVLRESQIKKRAH